MAKKVVRRKKLRIVPFLVFLLIIGIIFGVVFYILTRPTSNLIVKGNNYLTDDYILETAGVKDYPTFLFINNCLVCFKNLPFIYLFCTLLQVVFYKLRCVGSSHIKATRSSFNDLTIRSYTIS